MATSSNQESKSLRYFYPMFFVAVILAMFISSLGVIRINVVTKKAERSLINGTPVFVLFLKSS